MPSLKAVAAAILVFITVSAHSLHADENSVVVSPQEPLFTELLTNMPFYLSYLAGNAQFFVNLNPVERDQFKLLQEHLNHQDYRLKVDFSLPRSEFILESGQAERLAKTPSWSGAPIYINSGLLKDQQLDIPFVIQLLIHELGRKLGEKEVPGALDALATKASIYFKAYVQVLKVSDKKSLHILSLPIEWFFWKTESRGFRLEPRRRPNTVVLLNSADGSFQSLTEPVLTQFEKSLGDYLPIGLRRDDTFADSQIVFHGADSVDGKISLRARNQKKLQKKAQVKDRWGFPEESFYQTVTQDRQLLVFYTEAQDELTIQVNSSVEEDLKHSIRTSLKQQDGSYQLTLPELPTDPSFKLQLSTGLGPILLSPEPSTDSGAPLSFRFQIPERGLSEFVEIHTVLDGKKKTQFLDKAYWFAIRKSNEIAPIKKIEKLQMRVGTDWRDVDAESENPFYNRWGKTDIRLQLQSSKKIRQVRLKWGFARYHYKAEDLNRPQFFEPMGPTDLVVRGKAGHEYAIEKDVYEETFTEGELSQENQTLQVPVSFEPKHLMSLSFANVTHRISHFLTLNSRKTFHEIKGEDMGSRELLDIFVTDENLETTSLLQGEKPPRFYFNRTGRSPCEEIMSERSYADHFE